jgi:hypothetical protein
VLAGYAAGVVDNAAGVAKPIITYSALERGLAATFIPTRKKYPILTEFKITVMSTGRTNAVSRRAWPESELKNHGLRIRIAPLDASF